MRVTKKVFDYIIKQVEGKRQSGLDFLWNQKTQEEETFEELQKQFDKEAKELFKKYESLTREIFGNPKEKVSIYVRSDEDMEFFSTRLSADKGAYLEREKNGVIREYRSQTQAIAEEICVRMEMGGDWETLTELLGKI